MIVFHASTRFPDQDPNGGGGGGGVDPDGGLSSVTENSSSLSTPSHEGSRRIQREALDLAIKDIQCAIQRSKSMTLKSPSTEPPSNGRRDEPVWIMRSVVY